ncbi:MAG: dihydroorotate dehydrogenase electron transfer subunit [Phycisphaerae bacterium]
MISYHNPPVKRAVAVAEVVSNGQICHEHYVLTLRMDWFPPSRPGQFVQFQCRGLEEQTSGREVKWRAGQWPQATQAELANREPLLRRPLSIAGRRETTSGRVEMELIYRTLGAGTNWLAGVKSGAMLSVLGPLGNGFVIRQGKPMAVMVGGGVGIPPMLYLARALSEAGKVSVAFCGARSGNVLPLTLIEGRDPAADGRPTPCVREFLSACADTVVATDDGTVGYRGLVSEAFKAWLRTRDFAPIDLTVYCCGPEPMERAVADICLMRDIECQLALERHMACGVGTCQSCVVKVRADNEAGWAFRLCCADGPVFDAREVLW